MAKYVYAGKKTARCKVEAKRKEIANWLAIGLSVASIHRELKLDITYNRFYRLLLAMKAEGVFDEATPKRRLYPPTLRTKPTPPAAPFRFNPKSDDQELF